MRRRYRLPRQDVVCAGRGVAIYPLPLFTDEGAFMTHTIAALLMTVVSTVAVAQAPANPPVRIRGTIEKLDGQVLTINGNDGQMKTVKLTDNFTVMGINRVSIDDLGSGKFIGTTTVGER